MIEIRKEIVNGVGNVQRTEHVAFVDCDADAILNEFSWYYNKLAQAETKQFTLRGQDTYVRYVFQPVEVISLDKAVAYAEVKARKVIADCNNFEKFTCSFSAKVFNQAGIDKVFFTDLFSYFFLTFLWVF